MSKDQAVQGGKLTIPFETQAKFLGHELDTTHKGVLDSLLKGNTVADGNRVWTKDFEVPAHANAQVSARQHHGDNFWSYWQKNGDALAQQNTPTTAPRNIDAGTPTNRSSNDGSYRVASDTTTMIDASPSRSQQASGATSPMVSGGSTPPSTPSTPTPTTSGAQPTMSAPLPPRRPDNLGMSPEFPDNRGQDPGMPPRRPEMGPPMPNQPAQAGAPQTPLQGDGGGFLKDIGSFFSGEPIRDANGREWDALYGFEKQPAEATAGASAGAAASDGKSILDLGGIGDDIDKGMSDAFNWFSSIFK